MGLLDNQTQQQYQDSGNLGSYQFISLENLIDQFIIAYVGEDKLIQKVNRVDVAFHAQRALQELSFDTFKCTKAQEIEIPSSLKMILPQDYVNYVKLSWHDKAGVERTLYPTSKTSNPKAIKQNADGTYNLSTDELQYETDSDTGTAYKASTPTSNEVEDYNYDGDNYDLNTGKRYGIFPANSSI